MLFPSPYHGVLAVKGFARYARLRPGGRLRPLTACAAPCPGRVRQFRPATFQEFTMNNVLITAEQRIVLLAGRIVV